LRLPNHILLRLHDTALWADYLPQIPPALYLPGALGLGLLVLAVGSVGTGSALLRWLEAVVGALLLAPLAVVGFYVLWRRRYSLGLRAEVLGAIGWRGDETVLDVGCGNGLLLNGAAQRVPRGKAVGIDLWVPHSGGGTLQMLWKNARQEKVAERIVFKEADARQLPFDSATFDVVVSSSAVHHISRSHADFEQAVQEMLRVLRPGGQMVIADVTHIIEACALRMRAAGLACEVRHTERFLGYDRGIVVGRPPPGR
jgi:SAM-dependent methyltransferase